MPVRQTRALPDEGVARPERAGDAGRRPGAVRRGGYPRTPERLLYRDEPILLAMNERFSPLAPAVDAPPTAPPERRQLLEWSMLVDEVGTGDRGTIATYSSPDWLSANRSAAGPTRTARLAARRGAVARAGGA